MRARHIILAVSLAIVADAQTAMLRADDVVTVADRLVHQHLSYIYGSEDLRNGGLDCSGFVQVVFHDACKVDLPNEADKQLDYLRAHGQVWDSTAVWTPATLQPGDLIFYAGPYDLPRTSRISHVMMYCGHGIMAGSQGAGRRLDGGGSAGVGYYAFWPRPPKGIFGESGDRFIGHRQVFAYGRLTSVPSEPAHEIIASAPAAPVPGTSPASGYGLGYDLKPAGINPRFD